MCKKTGSDDMSKMMMMQMMQMMQKMQDTEKDTNNKVTQISQALGLGFNSVAPQNAMAFGNMLSGIPQLSPYANMISSAATQRSQGFVFPSSASTPASIPPDSSSSGLLT